MKPKGAVKIKEKGIANLLKGLPLPQPVIEKNILVVVARRRIDDNVPELFFIAGSPGRSSLMCYAHVGQHSETSWDYYWQRTKSASMQDADVAALVKEWGNQPPLTEFEVHTAFAPWGHKIA